MVKEVTGTIDKCPTCGRKKKRSTESNRFYWLLLHCIAEKVRPEGKLYGAEQWHCYYKQRFLGCDEIKLPNGKIMLIPHSTADLDSPEFNEYVSQVEAHAAEHDVFLDEMVA